MALIVEDGTGLANAESYVSLSDLSAYIASRGLTLSGSDTAKERLVRRAMDYVESYGHRFTGIKLTREQALQWPRAYARIDGFDPPSDEIPQRLKNAVCQLAVDISSQDEFPIGDGREVIKEKIGAIETEYQPSGQRAILPVFSKVEALLRPLLRSGGGLSTYRA